MKSLMLMIVVESLNDLYPLNKDLCSLECTYIKINAFLTEFFFFFKLMSLMPKMHLLFPLTLVRSFWSDVMDSAQSFITSSWTFYLQADDGKIVIFQVMTVLHRFI